MDVTLRYSFLNTATSGLIETKPRLQHARSSHRVHSHVVRSIKTVSVSIEELPVRHGVK
jgi:hypothetical protein